MEIPAIFNPSPPNYTLVYNHQPIFNPSPPNNYQLLFKPFPPNYTTINSASTHTHPNTTINSSSINPRPTTINSSSTHPQSPSNYTAINLFSTYPHPTIQPSTHLQSIPTQLYNHQLIFNPSSTNHIQNTTINSSSKHSLSNYTSTNPTIQLSTQLHQPYHHEEKTLPLHQTFTNKKPSFASYVL